MIKELPEVPHVATRLAVAFFAVVVVAPPILIALCFVPAGMAAASMVILLLMFALVGGCVMRAQNLERAITRGLFAAGIVLLVFPLVFAGSALAGSLGIHVAAGQNVDEAIGLRNMLLVYDVAVGASCLALAYLMWARAQRQAGLNPELADAELRQAFWEVRQLFHSGT